MKVMRDGALVSIKYKLFTKQTAQRTFDKILSHFKQGCVTNVIPILRDMNKVNAFLRSINKKTPLHVERDRSIHNEADGAVAGRDDDEDEEKTSGARACTVSRAAIAVRARDKLTKLKNIKSSYSN